MDRLEVVIDYLQKLPSDFYGQILIRVRQGRPTLITEERTIKLEDSEEEHPQTLKRCAGRT